MCKTHLSVISTTTSSKASLLEPKKSISLSLQLQWVGFYCLAWSRVLTATSFSSTENTCVIWIFILISDWSESYLVPTIIKESNEQPTIDKQQDNNSNKYENSNLISIQNCIKLPEEYRILIRDGEDAFYVV